MKDEAGPLWLMMENFLESLPVKPKWILLAGVVMVLVVVLLRAVKRRK